MLQRYDDIQENDRRLGVYHVFALDQVIARQAFLPFHGFHVLRWRIDRPILRHEAQHLQQQRPQKKLVWVTEDDSGVANYDLQNMLLILKLQKVLEFEIMGNLRAMNIWGAKKNKLNYCILNLFISQDYKPPLSNCYFTINPLYIYMYLYSTYPNADAPHLCFELNTNKRWEWSQSSNRSGESPCARKPFFYHITS